MKLSVVDIHEVTMNRINTYQVHNNSLKFMKLSNMNFNKQNHEQNQNLSSS